MSDGSAVRVMTRNLRAKNKRTSNTFIDYMHEELRNDDYAAIFLDAALKDGKEAFFLEY